MMARVALVHIWAILPNSDKFSMGHGTDCVRTLMLTLFKPAKAQTLSGRCFLFMADLVSNYRNNCVVSLGKNRITVVSCVGFRMEFVAQHASNTELTAFCQPELRAVANMLGCPVSIALRCDKDPAARIKGSSVYFSFCRFGAEDPHSGSIHVGDDGDRLPLSEASIHVAEVSALRMQQQLLLRIVRRTVLVEEIFVPLVVSASLPEAVAAFSKLPMFDPKRFRPVLDLPLPGMEETLTRMEGVGVQSVDDADRHQKDCGSGGGEETTAPLTFSVRVESYEHRYAPNEKLAILQQFPFNHFHPTGRVQLLNARDRFVIFLEHEKVPTPAGTTSGPSTGSLRRVLVCHAITGPSARRALLEQYSLKYRPYIGTTSMPPELTFLMCNLAHVQKSDLVMDPFCGTGSSLVTAGHWGAMTVGTDMDGRVLRRGTAKVLSLQQQQQVDIAMQRYSSLTAPPVASAAGAASIPASSSALSGTWSTPEHAMHASTATPDQLLRGAASASSGRLHLTDEEVKRPSLETNFKVYSTPQPGDPLRLNFSTWPKAWRQSVTLRQQQQARHMSSSPSASNGSSSATIQLKGWLDAIVTDPPYGIREQKRSSAW